MPDFGFFAGTGFEETEALRFLSGMLVLPFRGAVDDGECKGGDRSSKLFSKLGLLSSEDCWDGVVAGLAFGAANIDLMLLRLSNSCNRLPEKAGISCNFHSLWRWPSTKNPAGLMMSRRLISFPSISTTS